MLTSRTSLTRSLLYSKCKSGEKKYAQCLCFYFVSKHFTPCLYYDIYMVTIPNAFHKI